MNEIMKRNRLFTYILAGAVALFSLQSCLFEQKDLFEETASARLTSVLTDAKQVLTQQTGGWLMYYYPDNEQLYGGFNYVLKFNDEEVTVWSEIFDEPGTSLYKMTTNNGPVLSFDTTNLPFHFFATPSGSSKNVYGDSGRYQAYRGDFEFLILSAKPTEVLLKGTRSGCVIKMVPFAGEDPAAYLDAVNQCVEEIFVSEFNGTLAQKPFHLFLDLSNRQASLNLIPSNEEEEPDVVKVAYMYSDKGIRLYEPVTLEGKTVQELIWGAEDQTLVSLIGADEVYLEGTLPEGWHAYDDFVGKWTLTFNGGKSFLDGIEIKEKEKGKSFTISGLSKQFDMVATYNLGSGKLQLLSQIVGNDGVNSIRAASWDSKAGYVNYSDTIGFFLTFGENAEGVDDATTIYFSDNRTWLSYTVSGFILYRMNGSTRIGNANAPWLFRTDEATGTAITTNFNRLTSPSVLTRVSVN